MRQDLIDLYDEYTHGRMSRRLFLRRLRALAGGAAAAALLLPGLENNYAFAQTIPADDPRLHGREAAFAASGVEGAGYLVAPAESDQPLPAVLVIHENRGLNPHIRDVARRLALEGFLVFAPDILAPVGGTPDDMDAARDALYAREPEAMTAELLAALAWLRRRPNATGRIGAIGFCWGGGMVNTLAVRDPELDAGVAYYGVQPPADDVARIRAAMLLHYAGVDERINAGIEAYAAALEAAGVRHEIHVYEGAQHAFNNDANAARYDAEAAALAWTRTLDFLRRELA